MPVFAADLRIDASRRTGVIRPLHGANCGPLNCGGLLDLTALHREIGIPFTRLHDCHWPNPDVVDMHAVFPNPAADPARPESYDFADTDEYIQGVINTGARIVYRLGQSIEHTKRKRHVHPPADPDRWAAACVGIIRHYNEGWASGFRHDIRYWEIWNEPENRPQMWTGSDEDFFRLYAAASTTIKRQFPDLKVGGPSMGYSGDLVDGKFKPTPFLLAFLARCRDQKLPLDFFSWHLYTDDPAECVLRARALRALLDQHGFARTELHFNEWNYLPGRDWMPMLLEGQGLPRERFYERMGGPEGAAFLACVLANLQDSPVDVANYYMADNQGFGLFTVNGVPKKTFYAFKAFRMLMETPQRLEATGTKPSELTILAGADERGERIGILVSNFAVKDAVRLNIANLPWKTGTTCDRYLLNADGNLARTTQHYPPGKLSLDLDAAAPSVLFLRIAPQP